jgi:polyphosphate kinase
VRVAGLIGQERAGVHQPSPDGRTPAQQLAAIHERRAHPARGAAGGVAAGARAAGGRGLSVCDPADLSDADRAWLQDLFMERVFPVLTPLAVDPAHPFPFIANLALCMALKLVREEDGGTMRALLPLPPQVDASSACRRGDGRAIRFVLLEDLISLCLGRLFPGFIAAERGLFRLIRDTGRGVRGGGRRPRPLLRDGAEAPPPRPRHPPHRHRRHARRHGGLRAEELDAERAGTFTVAGCSGWRT